MKRLIMIFITSLVILMSLTACVNKGSALNGSQTDPVVQYIRIGSGLGSINPVLTVISSVNELEQYYRIFNDGSFREAEYINAISKYSENYFTNNFLVIILLEEPSGSNRHIVKRIDSNSDIVINRLIPEIGTSDMATWNIIIELNNSFKAEQFQVLFE